MKREYRVNRQAALRKKKDGNGIEGHAAVFNQLSVDLGGYRERIMPGAFTRHLGTNPDVRALFNHDPNIVLGRTRSKTLRLKEDDQGLQFDVDPPDTQAARDVMTSIDRGDIDQCSFGFYVRSQKWSEEPDPGDADGKRKMIVREIHDAEVFDVSPVTFPAYEGTDCNTRSLFPDGIPEEVSSHVPELRDAKTKKVDGADLPASSFAYVGDKNDTSTWKLPIHFPGDVAKTQSHIRNALARFSQTKGIPSGEKDRVWHRIVGAAKAHGIHVSDEEDSRSRRLRRDAQDGDPENDKNGPAGMDGDGEYGQCACDCSSCQSGICASCTDEDCDDENCEHDGDSPDGDSERERKRVDRQRMKMRLELAKRN